ncbi:MAG: nucleoside hydrolase [Candidatus Bathyarchaeia archaeon]
MRFLSHVIIDTDPGVDDALALILALRSPEIKVEAVTTVVGNVSQDKAHRNALKILEFLDAGGIPVAWGAHKPLLREASCAEEVHGESGLGEAILPEPRIKPPQPSAVKLIVEKAYELGKGLTLVALGPLTNMASAILAEPGIVDMLAGLVLMGGAYNLTPYGYGNVTPVAEFNIWHDPEAARIVFESGVPLKAVGLDITANPSNSLNLDRYREIEELGTRRSRLVADLCRGLMKRFGLVQLHDPIAVAVASNPDLAETGRFFVEVETAGLLTRGQTVLDRRPRQSLRRKPNVEVCLSLDSEGFMELFMERVVYE